MRLISELTVTYGTWLATWSTSYFHHHKQPALSQRHVVLVITRAPKGRFYTSLYNLAIYQLGCVQTGFIVDGIKCIKNISLQKIKRINAEWTEHWVFSWYGYDENFNHSLAGMLSEKIFMLSATKINGLKSYSQCHACMLMIINITVWSWIINFPCHHNYDCKCANNSN